MRNRAGNSLLREEGKGAPIFSPEIKTTIDLEMAMVVFRFKGAVILI